MGNCVVLFHSLLQGWKKLQSIVSEISDRIKVVTVKTKIHTISQQRSANDAWGSLSLFVIEGKSYEREEISSTEDNIEVMRIT